MLVSQKFIGLSVFLLLLTACGGGSGDLIGGVGSISDCDADTDTDLCSSWVENTSETAAIIEDNNRSVLVNVQSVKKSGDYVLVKSTGIPDYQVRATQDLIDELLARPNAAIDFSGGTPSIEIDDIIVFGADIGFNSDSSCPAGGGYGFWPTSSGCPENMAHEVYFTRSPEASTTTCKVDEGAIGLWVNGTSIYGWQAGTSYNDQGIWHDLAPVIQQYDVDICNGHVVDGDYHHHTYSACLANAAGETPTGHSPIYGYAADGYPIYGPWQDTDTLAKSSWVARDYADEDSETGCGSAGARTCLLKNQWDVSEGRNVISSAGPSTSTTVVSTSENSFTASSGFYFEDYYWDSDLTDLGDEYLDEHNGHSDAVRGYHYHVTLSEDDDGNLTPAFPYTVGPTFYGKLPSKAMTSCAAD
jgi:hypothetical protein